MKKLFNNQKGITLVALIVTIIVLLILAGISLGNLALNNGILGQTLNAKDKSEIQEEKENLKLAAVKAMGANKYGNLLKKGLEKQLETTQKDFPTEADQGEGDKSIYVTYLNSGRIYEVSLDGDVNFLGDSETTKNFLRIKASPESNVTPALNQNVTITAYTLFKYENDAIFIHYAITNDEAEEPEEYTAATINEIEASRTKTADISISGSEGNYYLWVKVILNGQETVKKYGPYAVKESTTLVAAESNAGAETFFLNGNLKRNLIKKIIITDSLQGHTPTQDKKCWDVSANGKGKILAWYNEIGNTGFYEVTIGQYGGVVANSNSSKLFSSIGYQDITGDWTPTVFEGFEYFDTSEVKTMERLFYNVNTVKNLDLTSLDTNNVESMYYIFHSCINLENLDVSNWQTGKNQSLTGAFHTCSSLTSLDLSNWDMHNVSGVTEAFWKCNKLDNFDVSKWDMSNVSSAYRMFQGCSALTELDVSGWNVQKPFSAYNMFSSCENLKSLDFSKWKKSKPSKVSSMFSGCKSLTYLDVSGFDMSTPEDFGSMFDGCSKLTTLDLSMWEVSNIKNINNMFKGCSLLEELDLTGFNMSQVKEMRQVFQHCSNLVNLNTSGWDTSSITMMIETFYNCKKLNNESLTIIGDWDITNVTEFARMFYGCTNRPTFTKRQGTWESNGTFVPSE